MEEDNIPPATLSNVVDGDSAFENFKDIRFFYNNKKALDLFITIYKGPDDDERSKNNVLNLREITLFEFYKWAWEMCKTDDILLKDFFRENIPLCDAKAALEDFFKWKKDTGFGDKDILAHDLLRMVNVGYEIQDSPLSHDFDLISFTKHINTLFEIYESKDKRKEKYVGPYFCFVQSRGMGKTKLLWEYKTHPTDSTENVVDSFLIVPKVSLTETTKREREVFDFVLNTSIPTITYASDDAVMTKADRDRNQAKRVWIKCFFISTILVVSLPTRRLHCYLMNQKSYSTKNSDTKPFFSVAFECGSAKSMTNVPWWLSLQEPTRK